MDHMVLYRSRAQQMLDIGGIAQLLWRSTAYQTQAWLEHQVGRPDKTLLSVAASYAQPRLRALKSGTFELWQSWRARTGH